MMAATVAVLCAVTDLASEQDMLSKVRALPTR
ncbi:hypothetical protein R69746_08169 [Paraburkholderia aspalathi]|nr:hypothetical protein R75465_07678 [Paraburkholderia aspalathi]CAE6867213.1 hypothetical protein R69746_08169 [Paraburkholderia aspalathi]